MQNSKFALAGNRTPVSRVAGENSTTEPPMLEKLWDLDKQNTNQMRIDLLLWLLLP